MDILKNSEVVVKGNGGDIPDTGEIGGWFTRENQGIIKLGGAPLGSKQHQILTSKESVKEARIWLGLRVEEFIPKALLKTIEQLAGS